MALSARCSLLLVVAWCLLLPAVQAQDTAFDPSWYDPSITYVKVAVVEDGVYQITGDDLVALGLSTTLISPRNVKLYKNGKEVPLFYQGEPFNLTPSSSFTFVGERNRGTEEAWAYRNNPDLQSGTYYSLYTDTTFYWLSWDPSFGRRYQSISPDAVTGTDVSVFRETIHIEDDTRYYDGDGDDAENPFYTRGEGYYANNTLIHSSTAPVVVNRNASLLDLARGDYETEMVYVTAKLNSITATRHLVDLDVQNVVDGVTEFRNFDEKDWTGYDFQTLEATLPAGQVPTAGGNRLSMRLTSLNDFDAQPNRTYIDWVEVSYLKELAAQGGILRFSFDETGPRHLMLKGFSNNEPVLVFSPADGRVFELTPSGGRVAFGDAAAAPPTYWAVAPSTIRSPASLTIDPPSDWAATSNEADYVILTTRALRASAEALADYRRTRNGYRVAIVDVQDVYDQFDYGRPTPLAVRRFVHQTQHWRVPPRFLVLWGDAVYADRTRPRPAWEVISYGKASSDGWFAMQFNGPDDWAEVVAVGRLTIRDNDSGMQFIQKLQNYEARPLEEWQKRMLMLVGGRGDAEQATLQNIVEPWSLRATAAPTGMDTLNFYRNSESDAALDASFQDSLRIALRQGASWLSYFGHSAATTWEIVTDQPEDFANEQRLPLAVSLGCRTGAFAGGSAVTSDTPVLAEKLVIGSPNGAIAHWGTSGLGGVSASARMGNELHTLVFSDTLRTVGLIFQEVKRRYAAVDFFSLRDLVQFSLIGDPATRLDIPTRPDFKIAQEQIRITPEVPVPLDEAFTVSIRIKDLGLVPADSITLQLTHIAPNGTETAYVQRIPPFRLEQDAVFTVPIDESLVGENRFRAVVDPENAYEEVTEDNNTAERTQIVFSTELTLIAPLDMSALASTTPRLRVSYPVQEPNTTIAFELDTAPSFDTSDLLTYSTPATGTYAIWDVSTPLAPDRAYFWRARVVTPDGLVNWRNGTFFVEEGFTGAAWIQTGSLFGLNTQDKRLSWNDEAGQWAFTQYPVEVSFSSERGGGEFKGEFVVEGARYEQLGLGFGMLIIDGITGTVRASGSMPTYDNRYEDPAAARAELDSLVSILHDGDYVFLRTRNLVNQGTSEIAEDIKAIFRGLGSSAIDTLTYSHLWLMSTRVGHPDETQEWVEPPGGINEIIRKTILNFDYGEGQTTSARIGPVRTWERLEWQGELANADSEIRVAVLDGETGDVLIDSLTAHEADLSFLDAGEHRFLRLRATLVDASQTTTPQLTTWRVRYASIAELVLDPSSFTVSADTLQEGETVTASASILNLSDVPADTAVVMLNLTDAQNRTTLVAADTLLGLAPDATKDVSFSLATEGLLGRNVLTLEVQQPGLVEPIVFNNTALTEFRVLGDQAPPVLTVTIDGQRYPHNPDPIRDLQSPDIPVIPQRPTIEIVFSDENTFKLLTDTTLATVTLDDVRIPFNSADLTFEPATETDNEARIIYTPDFTGQDAVHTLRVTAFDVAGNEAEGSPYQFHFRIASAFEIGSVYPYPNPMGSFTQFAFLLKGADASGIDDFRIRIYTITGRVVQEFDLVENPGLLDGGQLRIGWNKVFWDGRDADGDLLATGVYLYKVYLKVEGESIEVNEDPVEKIVIIR